MSATPQMMDFHSSEWKFRARSPGPRSAPDELPLLRVEIHRGRNHRSAPTEERVRR